MINAGSGAGVGVGDGVAVGAGVGVAGGAGVAGATGAELGDGIAGDGGTDPDGAALVWAAPVVAGLAVGGLAPHAATNAADNRSETTRMRFPLADGLAEADRTMATLAFDQTIAGRAWLRSCSRSAAIVRQRIVMIARCCLAPAPIHLGLALPTSDRSSSSAHAWSCDEFLVVVCRSSHR